MVKPWGITRIFSYAPLFASLALADSLVPSTSFGHDRKISPDGSTIPGWDIAGDGHVPELFSDRIILTPPYAGNKRGSLWAQNPVAQSEWNVDFSFRASGEERGSGNLQLWYVKDGRNKVGTSSIYTVGQFDGFALVVDQHGGKGGMIRGFLNDGNTDYQSHVAVDSLAFGHCEYSYRNLGRPSRINIRQSATEFEVTVDQKPCFKTDKVFLHPGNNLGVTAASAENPDNFEAFRFLLMATDSNGNAPNANENSNKNTNHGQRDYKAQRQPNSDTGTGSGSPPPAAGIDPAALSSLQARVSDLTTSTNRLLTDLSSLSAKLDERFGSLANRDQASSLEQRLQRVEKLVEALQRDFAGKDYAKEFRKLGDAVRESQRGVMEHVKDSSHVILSSTPRMGFFIFAIVGVQLALAATYILYKRRRANMPKKFL
ncbi:hypothetical protein AJ80_02167 [Polytolypa hystricis UAMH7299]|uniref:L-type lectin-like domain-containing protein n=1 Tax=Polytolypa hystricis (strain UAMH7299) TaxID=1447883 RepID=A0A2B7YS75_POLH7|nr:hypothetical protein AJ80_02167 [Polytolypa hystricis UAMH7299]